MKTLSRSYEAFCRLLENPLNLALSFEDLCSLAGAAPSDLNEVLQEELGCSGLELLATLGARARVQ